MANVSLLGSGGGTVTVPITSADNATVAQTALIGINNAIVAGTLTEVVQTTAGLPTATQPSIVVLQPSTSLPPIEIGNGYVAAVLDGPQQQGIVSGISANETIISGAAGAIVGNLAANTDVFFGGGNNALLEQGGFGFAPSATAWLDGDAYMDLSEGETTVFAGTGASLDLVNTGNGANVVDCEESSPTAAYNMIGISGTTETAATVNAAGAGLVALQNGGAAAARPGDVRLRNRERRTLERDPVRRRRDLDADRRHRASGRLRVGAAQPGSFAEASGFARALARPAVQRSAGSTMAPICFEARIEGSSIHRATSPAMVSAAAR
jgi:hypothetical protein